MANVRGARRVGRHDAFTENRRAWLTLERMQVVVYQNPVTSDVEEDIVLGTDIPSIGLTFFRNGRTGTAINLTNLTVPELDALKQLIDLAFEEARPLAAELDQRAELARQKGNDSIVRLYRAVPEVHVRQRLQPRDDSSVSE